MENALTLLAGETRIRHRALKLSASASIDAVEHATIDLLK